MLDFWHSTWLYNPAGLVTALLSALPTAAPDWLRTLLASLFGLIGLLAFIVPSQLGVVWIERKVIARIQQRYGPNRVGPVGLLQPIADALKIMAKEAITPAQGDRLVFWAAPILFFLPAFLVWAIVPFGPTMLYSDLNIGVLYLVAVGSVSVIPVFMAGWSSNNKFALLGAMRAVAQSISYEVPMVLSLVGIILLAGSLQVSAIVSDQLSRGIWYVFLQPLGFLIFFIAASAELNRTPNDMMEAESEIVAGYHTEYSGMRFGLFYVAEYTSLLVLSALMSALFFGAWGLPFVDQIVPPWLIFIGKLYAFFLVFVWLRGTLPRLRIDQLMHFAWKYLLPLSLVNLMLAAAQVVLLEGVLPPSSRLASWVLAAINLALGLFLLLGWARLFNLPGISRPLTRRGAPIEPLRRAGEALRS